MVKIVILGSGRVGAALAARLQSQNDVVVIDRNPGSFSRLPENFDGETIVGNGIDIDTLRQAGVDTADVFLALTDGDNRNLMAAQVARQLGARQVLARVYDPDRAAIFRELGVATFSPTVAGAQRLFDLVTEGMEG